MNIRFGLRTYLIVIAITAIIIGALYNWHTQSMIQYQELTVYDPSDTGWYVEFSCDIDTDRQTASLRPSANGKFTTACHVWLCNFFDPLYVLKPVIAFTPEQGISDKEYVDNLKGVDWIILRSQSDALQIEDWADTFPSKQVLTWEDWQRLDPKPNTLN